MIDSMKEGGITVYLGLGSNLHRNSNLRAGLDGLRPLLNEMKMSPVFLSEAIGIKTDLFFNMVVRGQCELPLRVLIERIKDIETATGRERKASGVTLDIDVLMYGDQDGKEVGLELPSVEILTAAHVLYPLSILADDEQHPANGASYNALWTALDAPKRLWPIPFEWRGIDLTPSHLLTVTNIAPRPAGRPKKYICGQAVY
jgi:2-amino-4-hydroxy-6-hydroxymethyldihydropteridine diphosphokinase